MKKKLSLWNEKDMAGWQSRLGGPAGWKVVQDYFEVVPGTGDILTEMQWDDFNLHLEFWLPRTEGKLGQEKANSGVYLHGLYEIQILDSFQNETYSDGACGALYKQVAPLKNACLPPETWQSYDIFFRGPQEDKAGAVTVFLNQTLVLDRAPVTLPTGGGLESAVLGRGPLLLQDHGTGVRFKNLFLF